MTASPSPTSDSAWRSTWRRALLSWPMWPRQNRRRHRPAVWGGGTAKPRIASCARSPPGNVQVVEALGPQGKRLGHAEDGLSFGQPAIPDLEMQFGVDRRTEPDRIG